jgi:hypothetical protein
MKKGKVRLAIAPIAWTNDDLPELGGENTFEQCISEMALAGFEGSEVGNKYPKDPAVLKNFKVGDFVDAVYAEAIAINVQKPAAKPAPAAPAKK